jgi:hypothetical protein
VECRSLQPDFAPQPYQKKPIADTDCVVRDPTDRQFSLDRHGFAHRDLNELAPSHIAEPAADHCPTRCRPAENARHRESIEIENDGTANANKCGLEKDFCRTAHPFALKFWLDVSDRLWIDVDRWPDDDDTRVSVWFQGQEIPATFDVEDPAL